MYSLHIAKTKGIWNCSLLILKERGKAIVKDFVTANSYPELMVEVGNQKWIDLINTKE